MRITASRSFCAALVVAVFAGSSARAESAIPPARHDGFRLDLTLDAWFPRLVGDIDVGGSTLSTNDLDLNDTEVVFFGKARFSCDRWWVGLSGFTFETEGESAAFRSRAEWWDVSLDVGFDLWRPFSEKPFPWSPEPGPEFERGRVDLTFGPLLGVSYDDFDWSHHPVAGAVSRTDGGWWSVRGGFDCSISIWVKDVVGFIEAVDIVATGSLGATFGGRGDADGTGHIWMVDAGLILRVSPNIGVHVGYRLTDADFEYRGGTADVALRGLVAGASFQF